MNSLFEGALWQRLLWEVMFRRRGSFAAGITYIQVLGISIRGN